MTGVEIASGTVWLWRNPSGVPSGQGGRSAAPDWWSPPASAMADRASRSAPTQKCSPAPASTTTRASGSVWAWCSAHRYSRAMAPLQALRRSGRFSVTRATPASTP
jgi:hypothetical protein